MRAETLIQSLTNELRPAVSGVRCLRMASVAGGGVATTWLIVLLWFGVRADLQLAVGTFAFWLKWIYSGSLCALASLAIAQLGRPGVQSMRWPWLIVPIALLVLVAIIQVTQASSTQWTELWLGTSWKFCPERIALLSLPIFAGICLALREMAPTRLRATGAYAGVAAGACAATIYALACAETSATFVLAWYSLGIALVAVLGALAGPRLLRW